MKLLKQPNRWSCGPTALAMLIGVEVEEIIKNIGHDGSEIIQTNVPEPFCRRSFSLDELQDVLLKIGLGFIVIDADPKLVNGYGTETKIYDDPEPRILEIIKNNKGCIIGQEALNKPHMVTFDSYTIYDSTEPKSYNLLNSSFSIERVLVLGRIKSS